MHLETILATCEISDFQFNFSSLMYSRTNKGPCKLHVSYIYNKSFTSEIFFMQILFNLAPTFAVHHEKNFGPDFFIGTGSRFSACSLIKLLFSNLLLILSVNNLTHMYLSLLRVYFKVKVYFRLNWTLNLLLTRRFYSMVDEFTAICT